MTNEVEEMDAPQFGEEIAGLETDPPVETPAVAEEPPPEEAEETPEQIEEKKRQTGSARNKAKLEAEREKNRLLEERLARLEQKVDPKKEAQAPQGEPNLDDFETFADYNKAAIEYRVQEVLKAERAQEQTKHVIQSWEQKKADARKDIPDFDEVLADMETPAPVVVAVMNESDHTAKIAYHLAQHPDELQKINKMAPAAAALAVARIEAQVSAPKPTPKRTTQAPPPVIPVAPSGVVAAPTIHARFEEF